jgi:streptogramin lyase
MSLASPYLGVLSVSLTAHRACRRNKWLRRFRPAAALVALLCLGAVCTPATAQVTQLPEWTQRSPAASPVARLGATMTYDAADGNMVLFGGADENSVNGTLDHLNDTWVWNGSTWTEEFPATSPSLRDSATMAYDAATGNMVLFGGADSSPSDPFLGDTWVWNGSTWTEEFPATSPPAREGATMAYDAAAGNVVLFGGLPSTSSYFCDKCLNDTWVWNGTTWTEEFPATSPPAREGATMAYNAATGDVVLFGGVVGSSGVLNDTWVWNGSTWTEEFPAASPPARTAATMAYDAATGNVVLFGGISSSLGTPYLNDTWVWNGSTWTEEGLTNYPPDRYSAAMAYDAATGNVVLFGGEGNQGVGILGDTWTWGVSAVNLGTAYVCPSGTPTPSPCSESATIPFSVAAGTTISSINFLTQGAANLDFTVNSGTTTCAKQTYSSTTTCTVGVTFGPKYAGARNGALVIEDGSDVRATVYVYGTGTAPEVVFNPGTTSAPGGGFDYPEGAAVDSSGNVYIADWGNGAVKKIQPGCTASSCVTALGGGFSTPSGVAVDGDGNIYVADSGNNAVKEMPPSCASSSCVTALGSGFSGPSGVAVDGSGNVYVADWGNSAVKEMLPDCTASSYNSGNCTITTLGGGFGSPSGVAVDGSGNVYVADSGNSAVKEMSPGCNTFSYNNGTCTITTLGGGFSQPSGAMVDGGGNVYVADWGNSAVKEMPPGCTASSYNNGICAVATLGGGFNLPSGVAVDGVGNLYIADSGNNAVKEINRATPPSLSFAETNVGTESSNSPQTVTLANIGNAALTFPVLSSGNNPSISTGFQLDSSTTCPQLSTSSSAATLAASASCALAVDFVPTAPGSITGSLVLTDNTLNAAAPVYAIQTISLSGMGRGAQITLSPTSLPAVTYGTSYSVTITSSGGTPSYTYSVSTGSLPTGLTLSASGTVSGTPTETGMYSFTIEAMDNNGFTGTQNYTLNVNPAMPTISISDIPSNALYGGSFTTTYNYSGNGTPAESVSSSTPSVCTVSGSAVSFVGVGTCTLTASATATTDYAAVTGNAQSFAVNGAALTITANNATKVYGTANPAFTVTVTGAENGNSFTESFTTSATVSSPVGSYAIVPSVTGTDLADYTQSVIDGTLNITQAASTTSVQVSSTSVTPGQSVTLTATVVDASAGSTGTPTGTVSFYDNGTLLNTAALSAGMASYSPASLTPGSSNAVTATYSGNANFTAGSSTASTASTIVVGPLDFTFAISGSSNATAAPGQSATYQAAIAPLYGSYPGTVSFAATGLPAGATATFSPSSIAANGGAKTVTVTITTAALTALLHRAPHATPGRRFTPLALAFMVLLGVGRLHRRGRMLRGPLCVLALLGGGLAVAGMSSCGAYFKLIPHSYTMKVMATAGSVEQKATITLNVQ